MRKLSLSTSILSLVAVSALAAGTDRRPPPWGPQPQPYPQPRPGMCPRHNSAPIGRWVRHENLPLRQLLNLGQQCNGMRVVRVVLTGQSDRRYGPGQATLMVNGYASSYSQPIGAGYMGNYNFQPNPGADQLGREIQTLQLNIQGMVYVDRVAVILDEGWGQPGPGPGPGPHPGPYPPGPHPGPGPGPGYPQPSQALWQTSAQGGYYDATGRIQGAQRLAQMRYYGGQLANGYPVPMHQVLVNSLGHICAQPGYPAGQFGNCAGLPTYYE